MFSLPFWPTVFILPLGLCFYYFILAGARTFEIGPDDDFASGIAQFSFLCTGTLATVFLGYRAHVAPGNAILGGVTMLCALVLYEWARRTVRDRRFRIAWNGDAPGEVCEKGPYGLVRHPFYASYMLAFAALFVTLPGPWTLAILAFNVALFTHAAAHDEKSMAVGELAADYARYKGRTGMFFPRLRRRAAE